MLTRKQKIVLEAIEYFIKEKGYAPTIREIAEMTETTVGPTFQKVFILEKEGYISTDNGKARTIKVLKSVELLDD
jgi:SOS-response transcriptional repressor LexA